MRHENHKNQKRGSFFPDEGKIVCVGRLFRQAIQVRGKAGKEWHGQGRALCADRCVKSGLHCVCRDKWSQSEEAKHAPLLPGLLIEGNLESCPLLASVHFLVCVTRHGPP